VKECLKKCNLAKKSLQLAISTAKKPPAERGTPQSAITNKCVDSSVGRAVGF